MDERGTGSARLAVAAAVLAIVLGSQTSGIAQGRPPFRVSAANPLEITWKDLEDRLAIHVWNDTARERVLLSDIRFVGARNAVDVRRRLVLRPFAATTLTLRSATEPPPGTYAGTLSLRDRRSATVVHRATSLVVPADAQPDPVPTPAVASWSGHATRDPDETTVDVDPGLPIRDDDEVEVNGRLGILVDADGHSLIVETSGPSNETSGGAEALPLQVTGDVPPGVYKGTVDVLPDGSGGEVDTTITVSDSWALALLLLFLGVAAAWNVKRYTSSGRRVNVARERLEHAERAIREGEDTFTKAVEGHDGIGVESSVQHEAGDALAGDRRKLRGLAWSPATIAADDSVLVAAENNVALIEQHARTLSALGRMLVDLDHALERAEEVDFTPPAHKFGQEKPAFMAHTRASLLRGTVSISTLAERASAVAAALNAARAWPALVERLVALEQIAASYPSDDRFVAGACRHLRNARFDLWRARTADEIERRDIVADLDRAERQLSWLPAPQPTSDAARALETATGAAVSAAKAADAHASVVIESAPARAAEAPLERAVKLRMRRVVWDCIIAAVVLAAVLWTAFDDVYVGEAFGGSYDYIRALAWGLGAKLAVDAALTLLGSLRTSRSP